MILFRVQAFGFILRIHCNITSLANIKTHFFETNLIILGIKTT